MSSSPKLYRPTPHRPFDHSSIIEQPPSPLLSPESTDEGPSRTGSILNLTSSTLLGIYSPTGYSTSEYGEPATPWGTGAQTPLNGPSPSLPPMRRTSTAPPPQRSSTFFRAFSLVLRSILLFGMGMGYGVLVRHLHDEQQVAPFQVGGLIKPSGDWRYLVFWGVAGVALGSLLPWVDGMFSAGARGAAEEYGDKKTSQMVKAGEEMDSNSLLDADWTPVVRSVGGFVGIAFAIRKLPWSSTLQASLTLAFVNPVLWYLIDRSVPGLLLSSAVGFTGTLLHFLVSPEIMPSPVLSANSTASHHKNLLVELNIMGVDLGGYISRETIEGAIWVLSVLFCSCVCFGNIGRRLALSGFGMRKDVGRNVEISSRRR
ncbi:Protein NSG2 [Lachnellula occidentalis]|uniref:Protein NSG2 n=1 Tax=Lachnellula occidentalis TaxID=215460 RepID=A0A8H8RRJ3_9HELO|nr:Protein NSG2 [Lachnellula occidentalis]